MGRESSVLTRRRLWAFRVIAIALGLLLALLALEIIVRVQMAVRPNDIEALRRFDHVKRAIGELKLIHFVRISKNPRLIYELIPQVEGNFHKAPVRINSAGFADRERSLEKPSNTFRIAVIGDSVAFGWGVPPETRYSNLLERFLNETATTSPVRWEVLNFAIPGYNTVMEAELLRTRVLAYRPDAIVLGYCDNDTSLPNFVSKPRALFTLTHSYLWEILLTRSTASVRAALEPGIQYYDPANIPSEYQFLLGWDRAAEAMREIAKTAKTRNIPVVLLRDYYYLEPWRDPTMTPPKNIEQNVDNLARELGFVVISPFQPILQFLNRHRLHSFALWVNGDYGGDAHPNAIRHTLLARELYRALVEHGVLPDSNERAKRLGQHLARWDTWVHDALTSTPIPDKYRITYEPKQ